MKRIFLISIKYYISKEGPGFFSKAFFFCCLLGLPVLTSSCGLTATRPKQEMSMAASAFISAKQAKAAKRAPTFFRRAEFYYLKAKSSYKRKYFNKAKQYAIISRKFSEKAEFKALKSIALKQAEGI